MKCHSVFIAYILIVKKGFCLNSKVMELTCHPSCLVTIKYLNMDRLDTSCDLDFCTKTDFTFNCYCFEKIYMYYIREYGIDSCNNRIAWFLLFSICGTAIICSHVVSCVEKRPREIKWPPNINIYLRGDQVYVPFMFVLLFGSES